MTAAEDNKTNEIDLTKIPDNTITIVMKNGGKVYSKGLTLPEITKSTDDKQVEMAMQRVKDVSDICINTIFYGMKGHDQKDVKPELQ